MRVRTATVEINREPGLEAFFDLAVERNYAWVAGLGHVYSKLESVAKKAGYTVVEITHDEEEAVTWVAVRENLIAETEGYDPKQKRVAFEPNRDRLGEVVILGEDPFESQDRVTQVGHTRTTSDLFESDEYLFSVKSL